MDKLDRLLKHLPRHAPAADLAGRIRSTVHRRHSRRWITRNLFALAFGSSGLWLASPGMTWLSMDLSSSGISWLVDGYNYLNAEPLPGLGQWWSGMFSIQDVIGASLITSAWLGILLMGFGLLLVIDRSVFQMSMKP